MQNLETYVTGVFEEAKQFLKKNFPEEYGKLDIKIKTSHLIPSWLLQGLLQDYTPGYDPKKKEIIIISHEKRIEEIKDDDMITNFLKFKMKRKNTYLVSMVHELFEAKYLDEVMSKHGYVSYYDLGESHDRAVELELEALDKLIEQSKDSDKQDFLRRKEAREKEIEERKKGFKIRGV